ncbi:hypothetical protein RCG23_08615 [Neobacillus sp. PS3-34]|uniref:hypothetical protein n=1 Tax=Neobacillus sp. PS3-34 TaxID=3070678 RepID=UPI0027E0CB16|nr:hypothetical protein [Neobacillus sp. PS3-34]WML49913.1 hypothetical protein RCG23_08615 [Neobacillus sp. PS3-34]
MNLLYSSILSLVELEIRIDKKNYIVEDIHTGEFYEMSKVCIEAIKIINCGIPLGDVEAKLNELFPEEEIDLIDFASQLLELELIKEINEIAIPKKEIEKRNDGFLWIPTTIGKFFFNKNTNAIFIIFFILSILLLITHPHLFPHYKDFFVFRFMALNILVWLLIGFVLILLHELGHILAMRSYALPTKLGLGHRLVLLVIETDMSLAWRVPLRDRSVLYLAGLYFDTMVLFASLGVQVIFPSLEGITLGLLKMVVFNIFIRIVYQCCIYMKTDLYFVFENMTGCYNLMENAWQLIKKWLPFQKIAESEPIYEGEKKIVVLYSLVFAIGVILTILLYVFYYLPQLLYAVKSTLPGFREPVTSLYFLDAFLFALQILISFGLLFYSWSKKFRARA